MRAAGSEVGGRRSRSMQAPRAWAKRTAPAHPVISTDMLTHRTDIQMRFGDTDALGHINNASFASYAELGRLDFLSKLGGSVRSLILASLYIDFRRQVNLGDRLYVESWVSKLGRTSVTL